jgi:hypothetical protein
VRAIIMLMVLVLGMSSSPSLVRVGRGWVPTTALLL